MPHYVEVPASREPNDPYRQISDIWRICIHTAETTLRPGAARAVGNYFSQPGNPYETHFGVDSEEVVQYLPIDIAADGAGGDNAHVIHIELCTYAATSGWTWVFDSAHRRMLLRAARLVAVQARRCGIPLRWLGVSELRAQQKGITSHANVTLAFKQSTHTDPGPGFPVMLFMAMVLRMNRRIRRGQ